MIVVPRRHRVEDLVPRIDDRRVGREDDRPRPSGDEAGVDAIVEVELLPIELHDRLAQLHDPVRRRIVRLPRREGLFDERLQPCRDPELGGGEVADREIADLFSGGFEGGDLSGDAEDLGASQAPGELREGRLVLKNSRGHAWRILLRSGERVGASGERGGVTSC
jgi:hypothetical protein